MKLHRLFNPQDYRGTLVVAGAALATGALITYVVLKSQPQPRPTPPIVRPVVPPAVTALGYLQPSGEVIHLAAPAFLEGARVEELLVKRGETVVKGQVIAILDSYDRLQAALQQAQQNVKVPEARLAQVQAGAKPGDILAQNAKFRGTKAELQGQISTQEAMIADLEAQLQGEKIAQTAVVAMRKAELQNAAADCQRYDALYERGAVSVQSRDSICLKQTTSQEQLQAAQANLSQIIASRTKQIQAANANLKRTIATQQQQIQSEGSILKAVSEVRPVDVKVAQVELINAQAAVKKAEADFAMATVRSPISGQILEIQTRPGELVGNKGIVDIGRTSQMSVTAEVYETDIGRVKVGQRATIEASGVLAPLHGTVYEIGLKISKKDVFGTDPTADTDVRVVEVKIRLDPKDSQKAAKFTNLQVNVIIQEAESSLKQSAIRPSP